MNQMAQFNARREGGPTTQPDNLVKHLLPERKLAAKANNDGSTSHRATARKLSKTRRKQSTKSTEPNEPAANSEHTSSGTGGCPE